MTQYVYDDANVCQELDQLVPRASAGIPILSAVVAEDDHFLPEAHGPHDPGVEGLCHVDAALQRGHVLFVDCVSHLDFTDQQADDHAQAGPRIGQYVLTVGNEDQRAVTVALPHGSSSQRG